MYQDLLDKAKEIDADYRKWIDIVAKYDHLSEKGKADEVAKVAQRRRARVAEIQDEARTRIESERRKLAGELAKAREAEVERRRAILGDVILSGIYRERLEKMSSGDILKAYREAAGDWEKAIVAEYGSMIVEDRLVRTSTGDDFFTAYEFAASTRPATLRKLEEKDRDLRRGDDFVKSLDLIEWSQELEDRGVDFLDSFILIEWRQDMADQLGLQVEYMTEVDPTF